MELCLPELVRAFTPDRRVIAADFTGFGRSDKPAELGDHTLQLHVIRRFPRQSSANEVRNFVYAIRDIPRAMTLAMTRGALPSRSCPRRLLGQGARLEARTTVVQPFAPFLHALRCPNDAAFQDLGDP